MYIITNGKWELVILVSRLHHNTIWLFKVIEKSDGSVELLKARSIVNGMNQVQGQDYHETFSPVEAYTIRVVLTIAVMNLSNCNVDNMVITGTDTFCRNLWRSLNYRNVTTRSGITKRIEMVDCWRQLGYLIYVGDLLVAWYWKMEEAINRCEVEYRIRVMNNCDSGDQQYMTWSDNLGAT